MRLGKEESDVAVRGGRCRLGRQARCVDLVRLLMKSSSIWGRSVVLLVAPKAGRQPSVGGWDDG